MDKGAFTMLNFEWPWIFILLPAPWFVYTFMPATQRSDAPLLVPFYDLIPGTDQSRSEEGGSRLKGLALSLIWLLLLISAGRPQWIGDPISIPASGRDLMLAIDISGSMGQEDMILDGAVSTRLDMVKKVGNDFIDRRTGDRIGLLLFGTQAYIQAPLTFDRNTVKTLFNQAQLGFAGKKTSIGDAIGLSIKRLKDRPEENRILILLTDGSNTAGKVEPLQAAKLAQQTGVTIYTIGVGADEMYIRSFFGNRKINPSTDLDEDMLKEIASLTGGSYFRARNTEELERIYHQIDKLEPVEQDSEVFRPVQSLFHYPLAGAFTLSLILVIIYLVPLFLYNEKRVL